MEKELISTTEVVVRFQEVDSMGIVWHGHYATYFEEGREAFGKKYGISYLEVFAQGFFIPLVNLDFSFKKPLVYGDTAVIHTKYIPADAAKMLFSYEVFNKKTGELVATGSSVQVFLDLKYQLVLFNPDFYVQWKKNFGLQIQ